VAKHNTKPVPVLAVLSTFPFLIFLDLLKKNLPSKNFSFLFHKLLADSSFLKEKIAQSFRCAGRRNLAMYILLHMKFFTWSFLYVVHARAWLASAVGSSVSSPVLLARTMYCYNLLKIFVTKKDSV
jgi:hypothetical protein